MYQYDNQSVPNSLEVMTRVMNIMAASGWEVVSVNVDPAGTSAIITFKRERS